jgi:hypothetical protein
MGRAGRLAVVGFATLAAACSRESTSPSSTAALAVSDAFSVTPAGFNQLASSYAADASDGPFEPQFGRGGGGPPGGPGGLGPGGFDLMGGGLGGAFFGDGFNAGFGPGPFGDGAAPGACTFSSVTGNVTCDPITRDGLTITRLATYLTAAGVPQAAVDSLTNTIIVRTTVTGTVTRRDSSTSTVAESSSQKVSGLAKGSTQRTVNGVSGGTESTVGVSNSGQFSSVRTTADTTSGIVIPVAAGQPPYPTAGTVIRVMQMTSTVVGQSPTSTSRREVVTYDGSTTAQVVITQDGVTRTCTLPLPRGHLACP